MWALKILHEQNWRVLLLLVHGLDKPGPDHLIIPRTWLQSHLCPPLLKKLRSAVGEDDDNMTATIAEITEVCEEPQPDWESMASSENVGSTWSMRRHSARMVYLEHLREHKVYEELDLSQGIRPLSIRWVDKDDYHTAKSRLTARGYAQELTGHENFYSATPQLATLRVLLVLAKALGLTVLKPSSKLLFSRNLRYGSHHRRKQKCNLDELGGYSEGLTCRLGPPRNESQGRALWALSKRTRPLCTQQCA